MLFEAEQFKNKMRCRMKRSEQSVGINFFVRPESRSASIDRHVVGAQRAMVKLMMWPRVSRHGLCLIALITLLYSTLLVIVTGCASAHADRSPSHHSHHSQQGSSGLDSLCAWTCQATADAVTAIGPSPAATEIFAGPANLTPYSFIRSVDVSAVPARAPPSIPFIKLG